MCSLSQLLCVYVVVRVSTWCAPLPHHLPDVLAFSLSHEPVPNQIIFSGCFGFPSGSDRKKKVADTMVQP